MLNLNLYGNLKVLYVDDEPENLQAFSYALVGECVVVTFESPSAALKAIEDDPDIAVVVADIRMPEMDGFEFLRQAADINPYTVNLILTGHKDESLVIHALNSQLCVGYHKKDQVFEGDNLKQIIREAATRYADRYIREVMAANFTLLVQRLLRLRDRKYLHEHTHNMEILCRYLLPYLDISAMDRELLVLAAIFHDIGKIAMPDADAAGRSEDPVLFSGQLLRGLRGLEQCWRGAMDYHERWDGTGAPEGKHGDRISLFGRILAVVDFFDAMASERADQRAALIPEALRMIEMEAGTRFDPEVVRIFVQMCNKNPQIAEHYRVQNEQIRATLVGMNTST